MSLGRHRASTIKKGGGFFYTQIVLLLSASLVGNAFAQESTASVMSVQPRPLKSEASCDVPSTAIKSCLVSLPTTDGLRAKKDFSFVDVRSSTEFDQYHIAGSINIPPHLLKTKEFLKKTHAVLLDDGRNTIELEKTCHELRRNGFEQVSVLDGGLFAWNASQRPLEGDPLEISKLNLLTVNELFEIRSVDSLLVLDITTAGAGKDMRTWLPKKITSIPYRAKDGSTLKISKFIQETRKKNPQKKLLLIADSNEVYEQIDVKIKPAGAASGVLRLDGGIKGYKDHVTKQMALWRQENIQNQPRKYEACRG